MSSISNISFLTFVGFYFYHFDKTNPFLIDYMYVIVYL